MPHQTWEFRLLGLAGVAFLFFTVRSFTALTVALNTASVLIFTVCLWAAQAVLGAYPRPAFGKALIDTLATSIRLLVLRHIPVPLTQRLIGHRTPRAIGVNQHINGWTSASFAWGLLATRTVDAAVQSLVPRFSLSRLFTRIVGSTF